MPRTHHMRRHSAICLLFLLLLLSAASCNKKAPKAIQGTWGIDHEAMIQEALKDDMNAQEKELARALAQTLQFNLRLQADRRYEFYVATADEYQVSTGKFSTERLAPQRAQLTFVDQNKNTKYAYIDLEDEDHFLLQFIPEPDEPFDPKQALPIRRLSQDSFDQRTQFILQQRDAEQNADEPQHNSEQLLYGAWLLQNDATLAQLPKAQQPAAAAWIDNTRLGMIFSPDHRLEMHLAILGDNQYSEGKYRVLEAEPDRLALQMITDQDDTPDIMIAVFLDEERMLLSPVQNDAQDNKNSRAEPLILQRTTKKDLYNAVNQNHGLPTLRSLGLD